MRTIAKTRLVSPRAVIIALLLAVINDYWIVQLEVVRYSFATYAAPFYNVIFTLFVLTGANLMVRKWRPDLALSRVELLTIYVMLSVTSAVNSHNMMQILVSMMGYAFYFQTPENRYADLFLDRLPRCLVVRDPLSLKNFYQGNSSFYLPENYLPWLTPILCWSIFCAVLLFTMLCLNSILRKQWVESERLTFPIIVLPLEMTEDSGSLFKHRYFWTGFAIAGAITLLAGFHHLWPGIPYIRIVRQNIGSLITQKPWNAMGGIMVGFYFWAIGLAYLMPLELSTSCWIFFWLIKLEVVASQALGLNDAKMGGMGFDSSYPYLNSQSYGAYLGFFVMSMWSARRYLGRVWRTAFRGTKEEDETDEAVSYRTAILGALAGLLFMGGFAHRIGMSLPIIGVFLLFYFIFAIICCRIRAELGFPTHDMHIMQPHHLILTALGTEHTPRQDMVGFSLFFWFNRTYASHPAPHQLEAFKIAERTHTPARQIFNAALIAGIFAMPIGFWMLLHNYFQIGGATSKMEEWALGMGNGCWNDLANRLNPAAPASTNWTSLGFVGVGFAGSMLLGWLRLRYMWFPLHPLAYAIGNSWGVAQLWVPLLIGSMVKSAMLKFGGLPTYRRSLPFFFGLILGEIVIGSLWTIVGIALGIPTYDFWPGRPR